MIKVKKLALLTAAAMVVATTAGARSGLAGVKIQHQNLFQKAQGMEKVAVKKLPNGVTVTVKAKAVDNDDDDHSYTLDIHNESSYDITSLYLSPSNKEDWGDDLLEDGATLDAGESVTVTFNPDADDYDETEWDMKIEIEGDDIVYEGIKLENAHHDEITLHDGGKFEEEEDGDDDDDDDDSDDDDGDDDDDE